MALRVCGRDLVGGSAADLAEIVACRVRWDSAAEVATCEIEDVIDHPAHPITRPPDPRRDDARFAVECRVTRELVCGDLHGRERIAKIVAEDTDEALPDLVATASISAHRLGDRTIHTGIHPDHRRAIRAGRRERKELAEQHRAKFAVLPAECLDSDTVAQLLERRTLGEPTESEICRYGLPFDPIREPFEEFVDVIRENRVRRTIHMDCGLPMADDPITLPPQILGNFDRGHELIVAALPRGGICAMSAHSVRMRSNATG